MNPLTAQVFVSAIRNLFIVGVLLFLPAWSFDFWQAWVFLVVYFGPQLLMMGWFRKNDPALLKRRLNLGPAAENRRIQKVVMSLVRIFFILKLLVPGLDHRFGWSHIPVPAVMMADVFILLGFLFQFFVFRENTFASAIIEIADGQKVISTGPYARVRHPMYLGALLVNLCVSVALGSWWGLPFAVAALAVFVVRLLDEEKFLRENLPGYDDYCRRVRCRLIPHVW